jgi:hypothetical protein
MRTQIVARDAAGKHDGEGEGEGEAPGRDRFKVARLVGTLLGVALVLVGASLATRYAAYRIELADPESSSLATALALMRLFDVSSERNVPTWFSSSLLLSCGLLAAGVGLLARRAGTAGLMPWLLFALLLTGLSLDEAAALHERLRGPTADLLGKRARGALRFAWVVPGAAIVTAIGLAYARFVWRLPSAARRLVVAGAALFVTGALGLEIVSAAVLEAQGDRARYILVTAAEEWLEMAGAVLLLAAMLRLLRVRRVADGYRLGVALG